MHPYRSFSPEETKQEEIKVDPRLVKPHLRLLKWLIWRTDSYWVLRDDGFKVHVPWGD